MQNYILPHNLVNLSKKKVICRQPQRDSGICRHSLEWLVLKDIPQESKLTSEERSGVQEVMVSKEVKIPE